MGTRNRSIPSVTHVMPATEELKIETKTESKPSPSEFNAATHDAKRQKAEVEDKITTPEQAAQVEKLLDNPEKHWVRINSKDKTLHRVLTVIPRFTSVTGEDYVDHPLEPGRVAAQMKLMALVERIKVKREGSGQERRVIIETLGTFTMAALKFCEDFEGAD